MSVVPSYSISLKDIINLFLQKKKVKFSYDWMDNERKKEGEAG